MYFRRPIRMELLLQRSDAAKGLLVGTERTFIAGMSSSDDDKHLDILKEQLGLNTTYSAA